MDSALREILTSTIVHQPQLESDVYDAGIFGAARLLSARVVEEVRELRLPDNRLVAVRGYLILDAEAADVRERDRIYLDAAALDATPVAVVAVSLPRDMDGTPHHIRVEFA